MTPTPIIITVAPVSAQPDYFQAWLADRNLCPASRTPFCDGARALLALGYSPTAPVVMRSADSATDRLRSTVGQAARLTVATGAQGRPKFRLWKAPPASAAAPPIRFPQNSDLPCLGARLLEPIP